jgi:hypothetical protein
LKGEERRKAFNPAKATKEQFLILIMSAFLSLVNERAGQRAQECARKSNMSNAESVGEMWDHLSK